MRKMPWNMKFSIQQVTLNKLNNVRQYPDSVRLFHTSTLLRSVELSKEWQGVRD